MKTFTWYCRDYAGYGDLVGPLCYAQNVGEIFDTKVKLIMKWSYSSNSSKKDLPHERMSCIFEKFNFPNVILEYDYRNKWSPHYTNEKLRKPVFINKLHNIYFPIPASSITPTYTVVCSPINNNESFKTFSEGLRIWKDVMTERKWKQLIDQPNTIHIDYRTPVSEAIDILYNCKFFIGYHGSCAWLARLMGIPMKIYSFKLGLTYYTFPWNSDSTDTPEQRMMRVDKYRFLRDNFINEYREAMSDGFSNDIRKLLLEEEIGL